MNQNEKAAMREVWSGRSVESVARKYGLNAFWLRMVTGERDK